MPFEYVSSFGTHPLWIIAKLGMERWCKVFYIPTGEIRDSDAIRDVSSFRTHPLWIRAKLSMKLVQLKK